jgi:cytochrome c-type biogenesis protein CcmE
VSRSPVPLWRRGRWQLTLLGVVAAAAVALMATSSVQGAMTYYVTPTEIAADPGLARGNLRVGGMVVPGTVERSGASVQFRLTDGAHDLDVLSRDTLPETFRAGQGAVVEGTVGADGVLDADRVMVRHSNEYRPPGNQ